MTEPRRLAGLIDALERTLAALIKSAIALFRSLGSRPTAKPPETGVTRFGDYEKVEGSKYYPAGLPGVSRPVAEELPDSYGRTRLVMLVVDPWLVHAYWEVTPDELAEARKTMPSDRARAVLRFYEAPAGAAAQDPAAGWFDVDVDLPSRNWYVHLWSADKTYYTDLGLRGDDGRFVSLARSNLVRTPPSWPAIHVEEHFMSVEGVPRRAEFLPPPAYVKLHRARPAAFPPILAAVGRPLAYSAATAEAEAGESAVRSFSKPLNSAETLRKKLAELYTFRGFGPEPIKTAGSPALAAPAAYSEEPRLDLTEMAERKFVPGASSPIMPRKGPGD